MKTVQFFKDEISKIKNEMQTAKDLLSQPKLDEKVAKQQRGVIKRGKKKIEEYTFFMRYVETNPTKEFLEKESDRLCNRINLLSENLRPIGETNMSKSVYSKYKKDYEKGLDIPKLRKQLAAVNFLK